MQPRVRRLIIIPALVAGMMIFPASAQTPNVPSVDVQPVDNTSDDPNAGQWFFLTLNPGQTATRRAKLINPAEVAQTVRLYLADLEFDRSGTPNVLEESADVGTWGTFDESQVTIPAREELVVQFAITAPEGAEPGDHVGVVVAESEPQGEGAVKIVKRTATRLYVTIPGDAARDFRIEKITISKDSTFFPRSATIEVTLRNTGRIRLQPQVLINGRPANGPSLILSRSIEPYFRTDPIPFWGGPIKFQVEATSQAGAFAGPARRMQASIFVFPWHLLALLIAMAGLFLLTRRLLRKRSGKYAALQSDLRRIEQLLALQASAAQSGPASTAVDDPEAAIKAAMKQARRAGDADTEARLKEKLEESHALKKSPAGSPASPGLERPASTGSGSAEPSKGEPEPEPAPDEPVPDSLAKVLEELQTADAHRRDVLVRAARQFGKDELAAQLDLIEKLPREARVALFRSDAPARPKRTPKSKRRP